MIDISQFDFTTQRPLIALKELLTYKPNNAKMLAFHKSTAKTRLLLGGKRSGKSVCSIVETCWAALGIHPYLSYPEPPLNIRYCSVDFISGIKGIILPLFKRFLGGFDNGPVVKKYWAEDRILELKNGTAIQMNSYEMDLEKYEGVSKALIVHDEEPPLDIYQSNFMRTIDCAGKLIIACTPIHGLSWLYHTLYDNPNAIPPAVEHWHVKTSENPHITAEEIEAVKKDPAMRDNLEIALGGEFIPRSNLVFSSFGDETMLPSIVAPSDDDMILVGIDPHDRNPWGVLFVLLNRENKYTVYDEILEAGTVDEIAPLIKKKLGSRRANLLVIDTSANTTQATSGKSIKDQLLTPHGLYCLDADKDISAGILTMNSALKNKTLRIGPNCVNLKRQFRSCLWEDWARNRNQKDPKERILKRDDHLLDSFPEYVQILTKEGWKEFKDLDPENEIVFTLNQKTGYAEYQKITGYVKKPSPGKILEYDRPNLAFALTPNHRLYVCNQYDYKIRRSPKYDLVEVQNIFGTMWAKRDFKWKGIKRSTFLLPQVKCNNGTKCGYHKKQISVKMDDWLAFFGLWLAEGFTSFYSYEDKHKNGTYRTCARYLIGICQSKKSKYYNDIEQMLSKLPFHFFKDGERWVCSSKQLFTYLRQFGTSIDKFIPQEIKELSPGQLGILIRWMMVGDGHIVDGCGKNSHYNTISPRLADDFQEVLLKSGKMGNLGTYPYNGFCHANKKHDPYKTNGITYRVLISKEESSKNPGIRKDYIKEVEYRGNVCCVTVPNEIIYVRHNGRPMWCGNSLRYIMMLPIVYRHPNFKVSPKAPDRVSKVSGYY